MMSRITLSLREADERIREGGPQEGEVNDPGSTASSLVWLVLNIWVAILCGIFLLGFAVLSSVYICLCCSVNGKLNFITGVCKDDDNGRGKLNAKGTRRLNLMPINRRSKVRSPNLPWHVTRLTDVQCALFSSSSSAYWELQHMLCISWVSCSVLPSRLPASCPCFICIAFLKVVLQVLKRTITSVNRI